MTLLALHHDIQSFASQLGLGDLSCISSGDVNSEIVILSDYPGKTEAQTKVPFSGYVGMQFLWPQLRRLSIDPEHVYTTNIIKRYLGDEGDKDTQIDANILTLWAHVLRLELSRLPNAKYILCMGTNPLRGLLHKVGITNWRGSVVDMEEDGRKYECLITYQPAYALRTVDTAEGKVLADPLLKPIIIKDFNRFKDLTKGRRVRYDIKCDVITTMPDFKSLMSRIEAAKEPISIDIEHWNKQTACIGLALDNERGIVIPFCNTKQSLWTPDEERIIRLALSNSLQNARLIGQNANTDFYWLLYKDRFRVPNLWYDTLLAHHTLYSTLPHSLAFMVSQYTWHPYYKSEGTAWKHTDDIQSYWEYNAKDTVLTRIIYEQTMAELRDRKLLNFFFDHVMPVNTICTHATAYGVKIDVNERAKFNVEIAREIEELTTNCVNRIMSLRPNVEINNKTLNSPKQLARIFYDEMKLPIRRTRDERRSTDKWTIAWWLSRDDALVSQEAKELLNTFLTYRREVKFLSTYVKASIDEDNRYRTEYQQFGVRSTPGRLSSGENQWNTGGNFQNQPKRARSQFIADDGCCFIYFDGQQAEARVVAWRADIPSRIEDFERARLNPGTYNAHRALASRIFNVEYNTVSDTQYKLGKSAGHGLNYVMMPTTFAERTGISIEDAMIVHALVHRETPELKAWWKWTSDAVARTRKALGYGFLRNAYGRELILLGDPQPNELAMIVAFYPQSTIGDWTKSVWHRSLNDDRWPRDKAFIPLNSHDSLTGIALISVAEKCLSIMKEHAEKEIMITNVKGETRPLIIPVDLKMSEPDEHGTHRWSNLKEVTL
jgi:uracil-DNA glycosylase family 4